MEAKVGGKSENSTIGYESVWGPTQSSLLQEGVCLFSREASHMEDRDLNKQN